MSKDEGYSPEAAAKIDGASGFVSDKCVIDLAQKTVNQWDEHDRFRATAADYMTFSFGAEPDEVVIARRLLHLLKTAPKIDGPSCPHCKAKMEPIHFEGYYDEFYCWFCNCDKIEGARVAKGGYA